MVKLTGVLSQLNQQRVLVLGDIMLDTYTIGKARRISPEAPVAVVHVQREEHRAGGAGNVVLNLISLGAQVVALGRIGNDAAGDRLKSSLKNENVNVEGLYTQADYATPVKNRILAENQQVVRVDHEQLTPLSKQLEQQIIEKLPQWIDGVKVLAISDYGKGFLSKTLLQASIRLAKERNIPIISDPKGIDFSKYAGSTLIKPNLGEAFAAANLPQEAPLEQVAERVLQTTQSDMLMITRSEAGISIFHKDGPREDFPVRVREVKDVTGAGDTVLAMLACGLANGLSIGIAAQLANVAAGIAIERFGCARITLSELARRLLEDDVTNKVFDDTHLFALQQALNGKKLLILSVAKSDEISFILKAIMDFSDKSGNDLLLYIQDEDPDPEFIKLLASLKQVNFILLRSQSLHYICELLNPEKVITVGSVFSTKATIKDIKDIKDTKDKDLASCL